MKSIKLTVLLTGLSIFSFKVEAQKWDFQFGYLNVFSPNALDYVVQQQNIERTSEGGNGVTYWNPINNGTEAILTQEFMFSGPTTKIFLNDGSEPVYNFGGGNFGTESVWASTDGLHWLNLVNLPSPTGISADYFYHSDLPSELLGANQIWIQDRMETSGLNIMAQYLRQGGTQNDIFDLDADYVTSSVPDKTSTLSLFGVVLAAMVLIPRNRLASKNPAF